MALMYPQKSHPKHGCVNTPEYRVWQNMLNRCRNPSHPEYPNYGGRGITVCERWRNSFENFLADVGVRPSRAYELDRYPSNDGNYEPGNCRWATRQEQCRNTRSNRVITHNDESMCLVAWSERTGLSVAAIRGRLRRGWPIAAVLTIPSERHVRHSFTRSDQ